ncbi:TIGR04222 domain-containing membrane protein [Streptomyces sp. NBC_01276]|uniref:TIGR04222 domain-containing membrane protein n=1 Tax=Streptomyces sp. NBC_01276 TaxID=2903808 RepID=UPI00352E4DBD
MWWFVLFVPSVLLLGAACARRIRAFRRMASPPVRVPRSTGEPLTVYEVAHLRGGRGAVAETAMAVLHANGRLPVVGTYEVSLTARKSREEVEAAVLAARDGRTARDARAVRASVTASPAVGRVVARLVAQGLAVDTAYGERVRRAEVLEAVAAVVAGGAAAGATVWAALAGDGPPWPLGAFAVALGVWAVLRVRRPSPSALGHGTRTGRALYRATLEDDAWEPRPARSVQLPSRIRGTAGAVARQGLAATGRLPELAAALAGPPPPLPPVRLPGPSGEASGRTVSDPPALGGVGCGGGCAGCGGCGGGL